MSDKNTHSFYPANAINNRPKNTGTSIDDVEAFIAKHGVTDLDANPQAKPRKLQFIINGKTCVDLSEQDYSAKKKLAKTEYKSALKNLTNGTAELRIKDENRVAIKPKPAAKPKPKKAPKTQVQIEQNRKANREYDRRKRLKARGGKPSQIELRAKRLADMRATLLRGESINFISVKKDKNAHWLQRGDIVELAKSLDLVRSRLFGHDDYVITLRQNVMTKPVDMTPFKGRDELSRRLLDGELVLADAWDDRPSTRQDSIAKIVKLQQIDITVIYQVTGHNKVIGWQIADK